MFQKSHVCSRNTTQTLSRWLKVSVAAPAPAACVTRAMSPVQGWDSGGSSSIVLSPLGFCRFSRSVLLRLLLVLSVLLLLYTCVCPRVSLGGVRGLRGRSCLSLGHQLRLLPATAPALLRVPVPGVSLCPVCPCLPLLRVPVPAVSCLCAGSSCDPARGVRSPFISPRLSLALPPALHSPSILGGRCCSCASTASTERWSCLRAALPGVCTPAPGFAFLQHQIAKPAVLQRV